MSTEAIEKLRADVENHRVREAGHDGHHHDEAFCETCLSHRCAGHEDES